MNGEFKQSRSGKSDVKLKEKDNEQKPILCDRVSNYAVHRERGVLAADTRGVGEVRK